MLTSACLEPQLDLLTATLHLFLYCYQVKTVFLMLDTDDNLGEAILQRRHVVWYVPMTVIDFEEFEYLFDIIDTIDQIGQSTVLPLLIRLARVQSEIKFALHMRHTSLQG